MKFYVNGIRRGLGKYLYDRLNVVETLEECDIFINCKHEGFSQVDNLYKAIELDKRVINIGSYASDWIYHPTKEKYTYAIEKKAFRDANSQLFDNGHDTCCLNLGYLDTESVQHITDNKMTCRSVLDNIEFILLHPHRVKEMTITPHNDEQQFLTKPAPEGVDDKELDESMGRSAVIAEIGERRYDEQLRVAYNMYALSDVYARQMHKIDRLGKYDIDKMNEEMDELVKQVDPGFQNPQFDKSNPVHNWEELQRQCFQIMLQSRDGKDFFTGLEQVAKIPAGMSEEDFDQLNIPEDWETARFIKDTGITRARLMVMPPKSCYTFHFDPTPRIHIVLRTDDWCFLSNEKMKLFHLPADGLAYYFDATASHSAMNSSLKERIHIMGRAPIK